MLYAMLIQYKSCFVTFARSGSCFLLFILSAFLLMRPRPDSHERRRPKRAHLVSICRIRMKRNLVIKMERKGLSTALLETHKKEDSYTTPRLTHLFPCTKGRSISSITPLPQQPASNSSDSSYFSP